MSTEIKIPFQLDSHGHIATVENPVQQTDQHVMSLVGTEPGERPMMSTYGVPVAQFLFDPNDDLVATEIDNLVSVALAAWEPGLIAQDISITPDETGTGISRIDVQYTRAGSPTTPLSTTPVKTAIIHVGGKVDPE